MFILTHSWTIEVPLQRELTF